MPYKHIVVKPATYAKLIELGKKGQTFDDIVTVLLKEGDSTNVERNK